MTANEDDYEAVNGKLEFQGLANETKTISINIVDDEIDEENESFRVQFSNPSLGNVTFSNNSSIVNIVDNDGGANTFVDISFQNQSTEVEEGDVYTITFIADGDIVDGDQVTLNYFILGQTATQNADFTADDGSVIFDADTKLISIDIPITEDNIDEPLETFQISISVADDTKSEVLGTNIQEVSILANAIDYSGLGISIADVTVSENAQEVIVLVTNNGDFGTPFTVQYQTVTGTATADQDYLDTVGELNFTGAANETLEISVFILDDDIEESLETFTIDISSPSLEVVNILDGEGVISIQDDDEPEYPEFDPLFIKFSNIITPNGDGRNDVLTMRGSIN